MKVKSEVPSIVVWSKLSEWVDHTPYNEGIHLVSTFCLEAEKHCNWVLFYVWCYVRTEGFRNKCWYDNWDACNCGKKFPTSKAGIQNALAEFIKLETTSVMPEETTVLLVYQEVLEFCEGIVYEVPTPLPPVETVPTKPQEPTPKPDPVPKPVPEKDDGMSIGDIFEILIPIALTLWKTVGSFLPLPKWVHTVVELVLRALGGGKK
jgi:hypothetical protein